MFQDKTRNDYIDELCQPNSNIDPELVSSIGWLPLVSFVQIFLVYQFKVLTYPACFRKINLLNIRVPTK